MDLACHSSSDAMDAELALGAHVWRLSSSAIVAIGGDGCVLAANPAWFGLHRMLAGGERLASIGDPYIASWRRLFGAAAGADVPNALDYIEHAIHRPAYDDAVAHVRFERLRAVDRSKLDVAITVHRVSAHQTLAFHDIHRVLGEASAPISANLHVDDKARSERLHTVAALAYGMAHELNQPLFAISNFAAVSAECLTANRALPIRQLADWNRKIAEQAVRAGEIVRRLSTFFRKPLDRRVNADINDLAAEAIRLMRLDAHWSDVRVELDADADLPSLLVEELLVQQVVVQLLRNAFDSFRQVHDGDRRVIVRTRRAGEHAVQVAVVDHGCGASDDQLRRVLEGPIAAAAVPSAAGLRIARRIVESHGGRLWAEHNAEGGMTFSFTLAAAPHAAKAC